MKRTVIPATKTNEKAEITVKKPDELILLIY